MKAPRILPHSAVKLVTRASKDARSDVVPFWRSEKEGVAEEGMYLLATELDLPDIEQILSELPDGYRLVFYIFNWEQSRAGEGFSTGISNSGIELVVQAAQSYDSLAMPEEAQALRRVVSHYQNAPEDYAGLEAAYVAEPNRFANDWVRIPHVVHALCESAEHMFYVKAEA